MTIGVLDQALVGIQQNQRRFERAASDIVSATTEGLESTTEGARAPHFAEAALRLMTARRGLEASLAVARTGDEMLGTLIDVLA